MRKLFAIIAVCCLLFVTGGYHLYFELRIVEAKRQMRKELLLVPKNNVTKLIVSEKEKEALQWEDRLELRYKDEMYDVIKMEEQNGQTIIWCISDKKETWLINQYLKTQKQSSEGNSSAEILKLLTVQFIPAIVLSLAVPIQLKKQHFFDDQLKTPSFLHLVPTPPPKVC